MQETKYELVLKAIAGLKLNDETPHTEKLQLCIALARGVLGLKPGEAPAYVLDRMIDESRISPHSPYHFRFDG